MSLLAKGSSAQEIPLAIQKVARGTTFKEEFSDEEALIFTRQIAPRARDFSRAIKIAGEIFRD